MRSKDVFWVVVLLVIAAPFLAAVSVSQKIAGGDKMSKRKYTNIAGLCVLGFFVIVMIAVSGSKWLSSRSEVRETEEQLNKVAAGFADNDREIVVKWATGGYSDPWGSQFVVSAKDGEEGYRFVSKGPDGKFGTEDDIASRVHKSKDKIFLRPKPVVEKPKEKEEVEEEKPSVIDKAKGWWKRMRS